MTDGRAADLVEAVDEELGRPQSPGTRTAWLILLALVLAAGGFSLARHPTHRPVATGAAPRHVASAEGVPSPPAPAGAPARLSEPPACPRARNGRVECTTYLSVPCTFRAAVRTVLPRMRQQAAATEVIRGSGIALLWSCRFTGRFPDGRIRIAISLRPVGQPAVRVTFDHGRFVVFSRARQGPYTVQVDASAPTGHTPALAAGQGLARDSRLVRTAPAGAGQ